MKIELCVKNVMESIDDCKLKANDDAAHLAIQNVRRLEKKLNAFVDIYGYVSSADVKFVFGLPYTVPDSWNEVISITVLLNSESDWRPEITGMATKRVGHRNHITYPYSKPEASEAIPIDTVELSDPVSNVKTYLNSVYGHCNIAGNDVNEEDDIWTIDFRQVCKSQDPVTIKSGMLAFADGLYEVLKGYGCVTVANIKHEIISCTGEYKRVRFTDNTIKVINIGDLIEKITTQSNDSYAISFTFSEMNTTMVFHSVPW